MEKCLLNEFKLDDSLLPVRHTEQLFMIKEERIKNENEIKEESIFTLIFCNNESSTDLAVDCLLML